MTKNKTVPVTRYYYVCVTDNNGNGRCNGIFSVTELFFKKSRLMRRYISCGLSAAPAPAPNDSHRHRTGPNLHGSGPVGTGAAADELE